MRPVGFSCIIQQHPLSAAACTLSLHEHGICPKCCCVPSAVLLELYLAEPCWQCVGVFTRWIRAKEAHSGLVVVRASEPGLLRQVENAVRLGQPLLLEELGDGSLPAGLDALYLRQVEKQGGLGLMSLLTSVRQTVT